MLRPVVVLALAGAAGFAAPARAECVIGGGAWYLGSDTAFQMRVKSGEPCTRVVTLNNGAASVDRLTVVRQAQHGIGGVSGRSNFAYQSKPGYVGPDSFVVELTGESRRGDKGRTRITVEVAVEK